MDELAPHAWALLIAGFLGGLLLFVRGLIAYRHDRLIESVATSSLDAIAAGEVRVSGTVEPISSTLISPLQGRPCVWYRARVDETGESGRVLLNEERAQEFTRRDGTGNIRVIPRGARWEIGPAFDASTGLTGDEPPDLRPRTGSSFAVLSERDPDDMNDLERDAAVQALLTVQPVTTPADIESVLGSGGSGVRLPGVGRRGRRYREARLEVGETVTIIGQALPWADVRELFQGWRPGSNIGRDIAGDLAEARAAGILASSAEEAWGNPAIPGFGIGRPTEVPDLHPDAALPSVSAEVADDKPFDRHQLADDDMVISRGHGMLAVYPRTPQLAEAHHDTAYALGVVGAVVSVICALAVGAAVTGTL
ncbi:hypothetical protein BH24CHL9_BH24CHL9_00020 [soil metagenome]